MKTFLFTSATAVLVTASSLAFAAPQTGKTRAEVRAELKALQDAGYTQASDYTRYPANLQKALNKVSMSQAAKDGMMRTGVATGDSMSSAKGKSGHALFGGTYRGQ